MVELMSIMYICCSLLSHDVSKLVFCIPQLKFPITVKSCTVKGLLKLYLEPNKWVFER